MKTGSLQASEIQGRKNRKEKTGKEKTGKAAVKIMAAFTLPFYRISFPINGSHFP